MALHSLCCQLSSVRFQLSSDVYPCKTLGNPGTPNLRGQLLDDLQSLGFADCCNSPFMFLILIVEIMCSEAHHRDVQPYLYPNLWRSESSTPSPASTYIVKQPQRGHLKRQPGRQTCIEGPRF